MRAVGAIGLLLSLTAGCAALPTAGPTVRDIENQEVQNSRVQFDLVDIDDHVVAALAAEPSESFHARFGNSDRAPQPEIAIGDGVIVSIWEAADGGLFGGSSGDRLSTSSHSVAIPEQVVGPDGAISIPFAGRITVAGRQPLAVQRLIEQRLAAKAIEPQVIVTVTKSAANTVTVTGEVVHGARVPLSGNGDRLLDVIAAAGGAASPGHETSVRLSRAGVIAAIPLETLMSQPAENIYARPGDVLTVVRVPRSFLVFGAAGSNAQIPFAAAGTTLVEALAKAGGLQDQRSDPAGVFLFRFEPPSIVAALGRTQLRNGPDGSSPVVYRLDLREAKSYFLARRFPVRDKDIIYVANADLDELQKFFGLIGTLTGPVLTGVVVKNTVQ